MASSSFQLSKPAILASVAYLIMAFIILIPLDNGKCDPQKGDCYNFGKRILTLLLMLIPIGLSIYSINCMVVGKCIIWSWVNSIIIAVWVLLFLIAIVMSTENRSKLAEDSIVIVQY